jgi:RHS repeat-associated protein
LTFLNYRDGALIREYVWNGWDPIAVIEGGVVSYVRADHIGRPVFATNATGVKVWTATYSPFGGVHTSTGALPPNRFPGQWFQSESGLHQNWMRDYDPTTGRYLEADPLGLVDGASVYGYVGQTPLRKIDPTGEFGVLGAAVGAGGSFLWQFGINYFVGGMDIYSALMCVDLVAVVNGGAVGFSGFSPSLLWKSGLRRGAVATAAIGMHANRVFPNLRVGDLFGENCDCSLPPWADRVRDFMP